jgi:hypothetical protein
MRHLLSLTLTLALCGAAAAGDIYCDPHGRDCSDRPIPGWVLVRSTVPQRMPDDSAAPPSAPASTSPGAPAKTPVGTSADEQLKAQAAQQAVAKDLSKTHDAQCKAAQERYQKYIEVRKIYREDKDGQRTYLSDEEMDKERIDAKLQVDQLCGPGG